MQEHPCPVNGEHQFDSEYATCCWCAEVTYRDVHGWFGDEPWHQLSLIDAE